MIMASHSFIPEQVPSRLYLFGFFLLAQCSRGLDCSLHTHVWFWPFPVSLGFWFIALVSLASCRICRAKPDVLSRLVKWKDVHWQGALLMVLLRGGRHGLTLALPVFLFATIWTLLFKPRVFGFVPTFFTGYEFRVNMI